MSPIIIVPFHQDEQLPVASIPVPGSGHRIVLPDLPEADIWGRLVALYQEVAEAVAGAEGTPVVVSGDCAVAVGTLTGLQRRGVRPSIVWFDAHGDVHTVESSTSGYIGGMSLRLAMGAHTDRMAGPLGLEPVTEDRVVLVDARDLDPGEREYLSTARVRHCPVGDIRLPDGPLLVHVDVDVIDPEDVPGLRYPVPDGRSRAAVVDAIRGIAATGRIAALNVACPWYAGEYPQRAQLLATLADAVG
ncbi:arginase family protein [Nocardia sp. NPDC020380]|uniref:arginase family protein n=1 Tax=Nocardia sp. NPDC020380 TaxID=3364309 RepID=UPI0037B75D58